MGRSWAPQNPCSLNSIVFEPQKTLIHDEIQNLDELDVLFLFSATNIESREYGMKLFLKLKSFFTHRISIKTTLTNFIRIYFFFEREFLYLLNWLFIYFLFFNSQYLKTGGLFLGFLFFNRDLFWNLDTNKKKLFIFEMFI